MKCTAATATSLKKINDDILSVLWGHPVGLLERKHRQGQATGVNFRLCDFHFIFKGCLEYGPKIAISTERSLKYLFSCYLNNRFVMFKTND